MIQIHALSKSYGTQNIFDEVTLSLERGDKVGLIGRNGHGKTTLFRLIVGEESPDSGSIFLPTDYSIGYLSQHLKFEAATVLEEACRSLHKHEDGWQETHRAETILQGLGFTADLFAANPNAISGGLQVRLNLAKLLIAEPNLLLLDEPTNYLDILSMRWLERFLRGWKGEFILITHDRGFMNSVINHTIGIHRGKVRKIAGTTDNFTTQLAMEESVHEKSRQNQEKKLRDAQEFIDRFRAKASKAKAVQSRIKLLDKIEVLDALDDIENLDFRFTSAEFPGKWLLEAKDIAFGYDPKEELLIEELSFSLGKNDRIGIIGRNGKGKSTLLKLLAGELQPIRGSLSPSPNMQLGYFGQTNIERLHPNWTVEEEVLRSEQNENRTKARSICGAMMFQGDLALKKVSVLSGGEKSRVLLGKLLLQPANLLLLDEPSNHLDLESNAALTEAIKDFPGAVMLVTHSEYMLRALVNRLIVFDGGKVSLFEGGYDDFLSRIGWAEEEDGKRSSKAGNRKEVRRRRAEVLQRKSKELAPYKQKINKLESSIEALEEKVASYTEELVTISANGFGEDAAKLSRTLSKSKEEIDKLFAELEHLSKESELLEFQFEKELAEL